MKMRVFECLACKEPFAISAEWNMVQCCPICSNSSQKYMKDLGLTKVNLPYRLKIIPVEVGSVEK